MNNKLAMVAFGGNALLRAGQKGFIEEQSENVECTCRQLRHLLERGYDLVIGHGNGPQVGNVMLQHEAGRKEFGLPAMPMDFCGAETQGSIAYLIETALEKVLKEAGIDRHIVSIVTRVEVAADDPMFKNPTKFVGPYYKEIPGLAGYDGKGDTVTVMADSDRPSVYRQDPRGLGWRKVVASPKPVKISNIDIVEQLAREGHIVITVGGGGIPVVPTAEGHKGVEAVIDKDLASALAAVTMKADEFYILTDVPKVYINYRKENQQAIGIMTVADAKRYLAEGQFAEGSMAPKVRAGIAFVEAGGSECIITEAAALDDPTCGTRIIA
ncbi:MAG: carbamate kinase [Bacteroidales bacterium]|nr:carbamate kinase [Bacteroidales bacterium]